MVTQRLDKMEKQVSAGLSVGRDLFPGQGSDEDGREDMEGPPVLLDV